MLHKSLTAILLATSVIFARPLKVDTLTHPNYDMAMPGYGTGIVRADGPHWQTIEDAAVLSTAMYKASVAAGVPYTFFMAVIWTESRFHLRPSVSSAGARGPGQLMPGTFRSVARKNRLGYADDAIDSIDENLHVSALYLASLLRRYDWSYELAAAGYIGGPGMASRYAKWLTGDGPDVPRVTHRYVEKVMHKHDEYNAILGSILD